MGTIKRYALDPSGNNPDNFVSDEPHELSERPIRALVPRYGPFFSESLSLYDKTSGRRLEKGVDYRIPMISQELTLRYGLEIADGILIENPAVSTRIGVSYQVLGGDFQNSVTNLIEIYENFLNDGRGIDWTTSIFGKPTEFPPSLHSHYLADVYGFEPLTFELERIAQAIMLANGQSFEMLYDGLMSQIVTEKEIYEGIVSDKLVSFRRLLQIFELYNANAIKLTPEKTSIQSGKSFWVKVSASNVPERVTYYWTIEHIGTSASEFVVGNGLVTLLNGEGQFMVQTAAGLEAGADEEFKIVIKIKSEDSVTIARSWRLKLIKPGVVTRRGRIIDGMMYAVPGNPILAPTARMMSANRGLWHHKFN